MHHPVASRPWALRPRRLVLLWGFRAYRVQNLQESGLRILVLVFGFQIGISDSGRGA